MENTKKILIVDDEASMRRNIVDLLSMKGYSLLEAESEFYMCHGEPHSSINYKILDDKGMKAKQILEEK